MYMYCPGSDPGLKLGMLHSQLQTGIHPGLELGMLHSELQTGMWTWFQTVNAALAGSWAMYMYVMR